MSTCSSCDAEIRWVKTEKGKAMPIDPTPVEDGNLVAVQVEEPTVRYLKKGEEWNGRRYKSHFATCPNADKHRR